MELRDSDDFDIFREQTNQFAQIDKLISETRQLMKPYQLRLKQLQLERKEHEKKICDTMHINKLNVVALENNAGKLEYLVKKSVVPVTQKTIHEKMMLFFEEGPGSELAFNSKNCKQKGTAMYEYIYGKTNRDYVTKEKLKSKELV